MQKVIEDIIRKAQIALDEVANMAREEIIKVTPRDPNRPPKDPSKKVTGTLKRSIITDTEDLAITAWVSDVGDQVAYAHAQEYGTSRTPARSYIHQTKNSTNFQKKVTETFTRIYNRQW